MLSAGVGINGKIEIRNVNSSSGAKSISSATEFQSTAVPDFVMTGTGCNFTTTGVITGVRFFWVGGSNFSAAGEIRVYGVANT